MIKGCFIDDQPDYYKDVMLDGKKIAKIHALTREDKAEIERHSVKRYMKNKELIIDISSIAAENMSVYRSLIGETESGWEFDKEITFANVCKLPDDQFNAIKKAVNELAEQNKVTEGISKN